MNTYLIQMPENRENTFSNEHGPSTKTDHLLGHREKTGFIKQI